MDYDTHDIAGTKTDEKSTNDQFYDDNIITKDSDTKKMSGSTLENHDVSPNMISNDCADYVLVECKLCGAHKTITNLRAHTKSAHKLTITEYKKQYGQLLPVEVVMHKCGICSEMILLDSDQIAAHVKIPGHNITHKNYNTAYMQDSRNNKQSILKQPECDQEYTCKKEQVELDHQLINTRAGREKKVLATLIDCQEETAGEEANKSLVEKEDLKAVNEDQLINSEPENTKNRAKRIRKKVISLFDYDEDEEVAYQKAMKASLKGLKNIASADLEDLKSMKKLSMKCQVTVKKIILAEQQKTIQESLLDPECEEQCIIKNEPDELDHQEIPLPLFDCKEEAAGEVADEASGKSIFEKEDLKFLKTVKEEIYQSENSQAEETDTRTKRIRKKIITILEYDEDEEAAYQKAMKASLKEVKHDACADLEDPRLMKKLTMKCYVTVKKTILSEEQLTNGFISFDQKNNVIPDDKFVKLEPLFESSSKPESEEVEKNITRHNLGGKIIKKCNICSYFTDRNDQTTMKEHLFSHFPDICGFACIVCRKTEKRKQNLSRHLKTAHSIDVLEMLGVGNIEMYEEQFSSNSDEQVNLRAETYTRINCENCKQTFFSAERMTMHLELGQCQTREEDIKRKRENELTLTERTIMEEKRPRFEYCDDYEDIEFYPFDSLETHYSDSEDDDFTPATSKGNSGNLHYEQLSIDVYFPGLKECLDGGAPYCCVIPSCNQRPYPSVSSIRRHLTTHDPEMYAYLICPICKYVRSDDHPGDMRKHVMNKHSMDEGWAKENVIIDISEKLQEFRRATAKDTLQKRNNFSSFSTSLTKVAISLEDPAIRSSFTGERGSDTFLVCGVSHCGKDFKSAYHLKRHYAKHDDTLRRDDYQCNFCHHTSQCVDDMKSHLEKNHPESLTLLESEEEHWKVLKCKRWEEFSVLANTLVEESQQMKQETVEEEDYEMIHAMCSHCSMIFNTQNAYLDHAKIHQPDLINYTCQVCQEGFSVESVFINHVKGHKRPYSSIKFGSIRCNGCSQYFHKLADVKKHLRKHHMNLLDNCVFCGQCSELFFNKKYLEKHMFSHAKEVFRCPVCRQRFLVKEDADYHISKKSCKASAKKFVCPHGCGGKYMRAELAKHKSHCIGGEDENIFTWDRDRDL